MIRRILPLLALALLPACSSISEISRHPDWSNPETITFYGGLSINLKDTTWVKQSNGVYIHDDTVGTGPAAKVGDQVTVDYDGLLPDGTLFDSSIASGRGPLTFTVGSTQYIPGFSNGVVGMRAGGVRKLVIPPSQAYGASGSGSVPDNTTIVFRVKLNSLKPAGT